MPRPKPEVADANGYIISELGKPTDCVLAVASKSTGVRDGTEKRAIYAGFGAPEYWRFERTGGDFHNAALAVPADAGQNAPSPIHRHYQPPPAPSMLPAKLLPLPAPLPTKSGASAGTTGAY